MTERFPLHEIYSPITYEERMKVQENWTRISAYLNGLLSQIKVLAGGEDVEELIQRINDAINNANTTAAQLNVLLTQANQKLVEMQTAITNAQTATQNANTATANANVATQAATQATTNANAATQNASDAANAANQAKTDADAATQRANDASTRADTATQNANTAKDAAYLAAHYADAATQDARIATQNALQAITSITTAIDDMIADIEAFKNSYEHVGPYANDYFYAKNNETLGENGSTYRAKQDTIGNPPPATKGVSNDYWQLIARAGDDAPVSSLHGVWRGATPPTNKQLLWWVDDALVDGYETFIWVGPTQPDSTNVLWLNTNAGVLEGG